MRASHRTFVAVLALTIGTGLAQSPLKPRGNGDSTPGSMGWLTMPSVQQELKLSPEQVEKGRKVAQDLRIRWEEDKKALADLGRIERLKKTVELSNAQYEEGLKALGAFLSPEQVDRFDQILFQRRGALAMREARVAEALKLTAEQKKQLNAISIRRLNEHNKIFAAIKNDPTGLEIRVQENARDHDAKALDVLDEKQKKTWEQITGPPFNKPIGEVIEL